MALSLTRPLLRAARYEEGRLIRTSCPDNCGRHLYCLVNPTGESREVRVERADDDAGMGGAFEVETYEMASQLHHDRLG